jgi:hypothetical protein
MCYKQQLYTVFFPLNFLSPVWASKTCLIYLLVPAQVQTKILKNELLQDHRHNNRAWRQRLSSLAHKSTGAVNIQHGE